MIQEKPILWTEENFSKEPDELLKQKRKKRSNMFSGLAPYAGSWTVNEVTHLLKRTMFGAKKADIDYFLTLTPDAAVDELLNNIAAPSPPVRDYGLIPDEFGVM